MLEILDHVQDVITRWSDNVKENLKRSEQKTHLIISKLCHFSLHLKVLCCHLKEMIRDGSDVKCNQSTANVAKKLRGRSAANREKFGNKSGKIGQQIRDALKSSLMGNSGVCVTKDHENWADSVSQTPGTTLCKLCKYFKFWRIL